MAIEKERIAERVHPVQLFHVAKAEGRPLFVAAPMVRYSKLPFRLLVQDYKVDLTYTPMILAHEFIRHPIARNSDFSTNPNEGPLIAQFASSDPTELGRAAEMIGPWVDGIDLNCGCPQSWAIKEGIGCGLMGNPHKVADMVKEAKRRLGSEKSVSCKIRIHKDLRMHITWPTKQARTASCQREVYSRIQHSSQASTGRRLKQSDDSSVTQPAPDSDTNWQCIT
ncbi:hypothetical protein MBLNU459_g7213t1 [Dothideomycetes sp. NU459]